MRKWSLAALVSCVLLAAGTDTQGQNLFYTVEGWPKLARADGKVVVQSLSAGASTEPTAAGAKWQDIHFTMMQNDHTVLFTRHSLDGRRLKTLLFEAFPDGTAKPAPRAPFAMRLSDVRVIGVQLAFSNGAREGMASITLRPSKIEIFTANQTATGAMQPGQQLGWDVRANKGM